MKKRKFNVREVVTGALVVSGARAVEASSV